MHLSATDQVKKVWQQLDAVSKEIEGTYQALYRVGSEEAESGLNELREELLVHFNKAIDLGAVVALRDKLENFPS